MHSYGDGWPNENFDRLDQIASDIGHKLARYGRIHVSQTKEKFGTVRVYCSLGFSTFYEFIFPRHNFIRAPKWLWSLDLRVCRWLKLDYIFNAVLIPYQKWVYRKVYSQAVKQAPHLADEILTAADWGKLLRGL